MTPSVNCKRGHKKKYLFEKWPYLELVEVQHLFPFPPLGVSGLYLGLACFGAQSQGFPFSLGRVSGNGHPTSLVRLGFGRSFGLSGFTRGVHLSNEGLYVLG